MKNSLIIIFFTIITISLYAQEKNYDFMTPFNNGDFNKALKIITTRLDKIYSTRVEDKRVPTGFITMKDTDQDTDLVKLFRKRKVNSFFIEDNPELSNLHLYAGRCFFNTKKYRYSLSHYIQALRFKKVEYKKDDTIIYEISQIFRQTNRFNAYVNALETAYSLNTDKYEYSLELANALFSTKERKKAIFHYKRFLKMTDDDPEPIIYLRLANLYEDIGKYLETEKYYITYLTKKPDDAYLQFALGDLAYKKTGNYSLALTSLDKALQLLPESETIKKSRAYEYKGDMAMSELDFSQAISHYNATIQYQNKIKNDLDQKKKETIDISNKINNLKSQLHKEPDFDKYQEYEILLEKKGEKELELNKIEIAYKKLNSGKIQWNIADCYEHLEKLQDAIEFYRKAIQFDYNANKAREKITKLQLKIKRGY